METMGTFKDIESAANAVENLMQAGFAEREIISLTSAPYSDGVLVKTNQRTWFRWISLAGGIFGACAGFALAAGTAWVYPVQTGDKPIIAYYPTGIITYELTMLFAILGTIVGMFLEMRLPPRKDRLHDPAIADGLIGISVSVDSGDRSSRAEVVMKESGAVRITAEGHR